MDFFTVSLEMHGLVVATEFEVIDWSLVSFSPVPRQPDGTGLDVNLETSMQAAWKKFH